MISLALIAPLAAIAAYFIYDMVKEYRAGTGTVVARLIAAGKGSATIVWMRLGVIATALVNALVQGADYFNLPEVQSIATKYVTPTTMLIAAAVFAIGGILARKRTL